MGQRSQVTGQRSQVTGHRSEVRGHRSEVSSGQQRCLHTNVQLHQRASDEASMADTERKKYFSEGLRKSRQNR